MQSESALATLCLSDFIPQRHLPVRRGSAVFASFSHEFHAREEKKEKIRDSNGDDAQLQREKTVGRQ